MRSFVLFLTCVVLILALAPLRVWTMVRLMNNYRTDEYVTNPKARRLYVFHMSAGVATAALVVAATYTSHLWWVETGGWLFFAFAAYRIGTKIRMRLNGSYREFYKSIQWR